MRAAVSANSWSRDRTGCPRISWAWRFATSSPFALSWSTTRTPPGICFSTASRSARLRSSSAVRRRTRRSRSRESRSRSCSRCFRSPMSRTAQRRPPSSDTAGAATTSTQRAASLRRFRRSSHASSTPRRCRPSSALRNARRSSDATYAASGLPTRNGCRTPMSASNGRLASRMTPCAPPAVLRTPRPRPEPCRRAARAVRRSAPPWPSEFLSAVRRRVVHHQDRAPDGPREVAERRAGHGAPDRATAPVGRVDDDLAVLRLAREGRAQQRHDRRERQSGVEVEQMLADDFVGPESPELGRVVVPGVDAELGVDRDHTALEAPEDRLEEGVQAVVLVRPQPELVVDRLELLVRRLELLVHRLELLVRRLELLVRRLELLVRRLQLLVRRLQLLDRRLKLLLRGLELLVRLLYRVLQGPEACDVDEAHRHADGRAVASVQRRQLNVEVAGLAADRPLDVPDGARVRLLLEGVEVRAQIQWAV